MLLLFPVHFAHVY